MSLFSAFAIFFIIWWMSLFIVLPYGNRSQAEDGEVVPGTDPGAPIVTRLSQKLILNTLVSCVVFGIYWSITGYFGFNFSDIPSVFPEDIRPRASQN